MLSTSAPRACALAGAQRSAAPARTPHHARTLVPVRATASDMQSSFVTDQPGRVGTVSTSTAQAPAPGPSGGSPISSASGETVLEDACSFLSAELRQLFTSGVRAVFIWLQQLSPCCLTVCQALAVLCSACAFF